MEADKDKAKDECTKIRKEEAAHIGTSFQQFREQSLPSTDPVRVMATTIPARLTLFLNNSIFTSAAIFHSYTYVHRLTCNTGAYKQL